MQQVDEQRWRTKESCNHSSQTRDRGPKEDERCCAFRRQGSRFVLELSRWVGLVWGVDRSRKRCSWNHVDGMSLAGSNVGRSMPPHAPSQGLPDEQPRRPDKLHQVKFGTPTEQQLYDHIPRSVHQPREHLTIPRSSSLPAAPYADVPRREEQQSMKEPYRELSCGLRTCHDQTSPTLYAVSLAARTTPPRRTGEW